MTRTTVVLLLAVVAGAAALRMVQLGKEGLWADECATTLWSKLPPSSLAQVTRDDNHAPLYYLVEGLAIRVLGDSEAAVRALSVVAGLATVLVVFCLGRALFSTSVGLTAALLLATSPMHVHYSQEARCYALLTLLLALTLMSALWLRQRPVPAVALILGLFGLAALYTHPVGAFFLAGIYAAVVLPGRGRSRFSPMIGLAVAVTVLGYLPWVTATLHQMGRLGASFAWIRQTWTRELPWQLPRSLAAMSHGSLAPIRDHVVDLIPSAWIGAGLFLLLVMAVFSRGSADAVRRAGARLAVAAVLPLVGLFLYSLVATPIYVVGRVDSPALPFVLVLVAAGMLQLGRRVAVLAIVAVLGLAVLPLEVHWREDFKSQEKLIAARIRRGMRPGDLVVATVFERCLEHYDRLVLGENLLIFPPRVNPYADWSLIPDTDLAGLRASARSLDMQLPIAPRGSRLWALTRTDAVGEVLVDQLATDHQLLWFEQLGYQNASLHVFVLP